MILTGRFVKTFLSTPSARRATWPLPLDCGQIQISIHALREEGDKSLFPVCTKLSYFYPRPPRGGRPFKLRSSALVLYFYPRPPRGGRRGMFDGLQSAVTFLSTPSARRATGLFYAYNRYYAYFYPRPPRGGRQHVRDAQTGAHTFLSTPSARRATKNAEKARRSLAISIHALREEGDG